MTTATSTRGKTEFLVCQETSSKELYDQLNQLKANKGADADLPIRAYEKGSKGTTLKIYNKKTSAGGLLKAAANPQRVSARLLVITTIENILKSEYESKNSTNEDKEKINQVLGNIKAKKSHCMNHEIKIPDLITDLNELKPIWDKSSANDKPALPPSSASTPQSQKTEPPKETKAKKTEQTKSTEKAKTQSKQPIAPTEKKDKPPVQSSEKPKLKIKEENFGLNEAVNFLTTILYMVEENYEESGEKYNSKSNTKKSIRAGIHTPTGELLLYVSDEADNKTKETARKDDGRKKEDKATKTLRAITLFQTIADSPIVQKYANAGDVKHIFSIIEKQGYISVKEAIPLLKIFYNVQLSDLKSAKATHRVSIEKIRIANNALFPQPTAATIQSNSVDEIPTEKSKPIPAPQPSNAPSSNHFEDVEPNNIPIESTSIIHTPQVSSSTNPFDEIPTQLSNSIPAPKPSKVQSGNPFKDVKSDDIPIKSATTIQTKQVERSTNPFDDSPTLEPQTPTLAPPSFFQRVADFFKPVTNFFASVRRFFGFK